MRTWTDDQLKHAVSQSRSYRTVIRALGLRGVGANYRSIKAHIHRLGLTTSHFDLKADSGRKHSDQDVFALNGALSGHSLRKRFLRTNAVPYSCAKCENAGKWLGEPLTLHLDHIDGNHKDCRLHNLRWLCPNCHSQTPTYARSREPTQQVDLRCGSCSNTFKRLESRVGKGVAYCSRACSSIAFGRRDRSNDIQNSRSFPKKRKVPHDVVTETYARLGTYRKTSIELGISDVAVKKIVTNAGWKK